MASVCSSRCTQRSTKASSSSSISSKSPLLATASFWSKATTSPPAVARASPRAGTQGVSLLWDLNLFAGVPPSLIHHQNYAFVFARSYLPGKLIERHREELGVYRGQDQPVDLSALGVHESVEVDPLVASLEAGNRSPSHRRPYSSNHRL